MKIVAIMPIKLNSERCPGKNIRFLGDKPLLQYELLNLINTGMCDNVYVYCSDEKINCYLPEGVTFLKRSPSLDLPSANFTQIFSSFIKIVDSDIYVYAHATAPFVSCETMRKCISAVIEGKNDSAFCAVKLQDYLWQDGNPLNFDASNLPRTQDLKPIFQETSGVYVFTKEVFNKYHRRIGINPYIAELSYMEAVDIDEPEDFKLAEIIYDYYK